jgi:hypothetical protein
LARGGGSLQGGQPRSGRALSLRGVAAHRPPLCR